MDVKFTVSSMAIPSIVTELIKISDPFKSDAVNPAFEPALMARAFVMGKTKAKPKE